MASGLNAPEAPQPPNGDPYWGYVPPAAAAPPAWTTDPGYLAAKSAHDAHIAGLDALLNQSRSQALIGFGAPQLLQGLGFNVDPNAMAAAAANPYSIYALLGKARDNATRGITNNLAARGLVHSGDFGYLNQQNAQNYGKSLYSAEQQLLQYLLGQQQNYNTQRNSEDDALRAAQDAAYKWSLDHPQPTPAPPNPYNQGPGGGGGGRGGV